MKKRLAGVFIGVKVAEFENGKLSINFGKIFLYPPLWKIIEEALLPQIQTEEVSFIVSAREEACLWAFWLCDKMAKKYAGIGNNEVVAQEDLSGQKVVVFDDCIKESGDSVNSAIEALRTLGAEVASVVTIINCSSIDNFGNIPVFAATTASEIIEENETLKASK